MIELTGLPGERLVATGLADLARGRITPEALAVSLARARMQQLGIEVEVPPGAGSGPLELALYDRLVQQGTHDPYARYNAMLRELSSFLEAAEARRRRVA